MHGTANDLLLQNLTEWQGIPRQNVAWISRVGEHASGPSSTFGAPQEISLDSAGHANRQQIALAVAGLPYRRANPVLADAIFLDVVPLTALETNADAARQRRLVVKRAAGVDAEVIRRPVGPGARFRRPRLTGSVGFVRRGNRNRLSSPAP